MNRPHCAENRQSEERIQNLDKEIGFYHCFHCLCCNCYVPKGFSPSLTPSDIVKPEECGNFNPSESADSELERFWRHALNSRARVI